MKMTRQAQVAAVALVLAVALFIVRSDLAGTRADLRNAQDSQERQWNNYLLAEDRKVAADLFLATNPEKIGDAINRIRGAFVAIAAAGGGDAAVPEEISEMPVAQMAVHLLDDLPSSPVETHYSQLHDEAVASLNMFPKRFYDLEQRIRWLVRLETILFLLTLVAGFAGVVVASKHEEHPNRNDRSASQQIPDPEPDE